MRLGLSVCIFLEIAHKGCMSNGDVVEHLEVMKHLNKILKLTSIWESWKIVFRELCWNYSIPWWMLLFHQEEWFILLAPPRSIPAVSLLWIQITNVIGIYYI